MVSVNTKRVAVSIIFIAIVAMGALEMSALIRIHTLFAMQPKDDDSRHDAFDEKLGGDTLRRRNDETQRIETKESAVVDEHPPKPLNASLEINNRNYGPMLDLLKLAGEKVDEETLEKLPDWSTVTSVIGSTEPIIFGLEKCASLDKEEIALAVAGMFNTGTNLLHELLFRNCHLQSAKYLNSKGQPRNHVLWQVPWGKHEPAEMRYVFKNASTKMKNHSYFIDRTWNPAIILPIVSIRDPYTWMQSMCRSKYHANWFLADAHCPNLGMDTVDLLAYSRMKDRGPIGVDSNRDSDSIIIHSVGPLQGPYPDENHVPVKVSYRTLNMTYESLVHLWNEWYQAYFDAEIPMLMVRAEDLVFFPEQVTRQVCECAGGTFKEPNSVVGNDLKKGHKKKVNPGSRAMAELMTRYGSGQKTQQMTEDDLAYAKTHLKIGLMKMNGYQHPEDESGIPVQRELKKKVVQAEPLIQLLNLAGENVNISTLKRLPTWSTVASVIGSTKPIISGLNQCSSLSRKINTVVVSGMNHSEASKMFQLLRKNCNMGRHRLEFTGQQQIKSNPKIKTLSVVTIRNPYTWILSNDRAQVSKKHFMSDGAPPDDQHVSFHKINDSLVDSWNEWYRDRWRVDNPKLFVRSEDVIFFPKELTKLLCECVGGKMRIFFNLLVKHNNWTSDHVTADAMVEYGYPYQTFRVTNINLDYAKQHLDGELMTMHGYHHPENR